MAVYECVPIFRKHTLTHTRVLIITDAKKTLTTPSYVYRLI